MVYRTGVPSLMDISERLCRFITKYAPVIQIAYPDSTELHAALAAALTACAALSVELAKVREYGD